MPIENVVSVRIESYLSNLFVLCLKIISESIVQIGYHFIQKFFLSVDGWVILEIIKLVHIM